MNTPDNEQTFQDALRLAQDEIKTLREQLLQAIEEAQSARADAKETPEQRPPLTILPEAVAPSPAEVIDFQPAAPAHQGAPQVLCVEDSAANFQLIESILHDRPGTNLVWADSGKKGVEMAKAQSPGLVLLDLDLPDMHGSEVLGHLRAQPATAATPIIVISADATPSQIERMLAAGASDYITKPFEVRRFLLMFDEIFPQAAAS